MRNAIALLVSMFLLFGVVSAVSGKLYRWADEEGNVHYTDTMPPEQIESEHMELGKGGVHVKAVPRAKTLEELKKEQELKRLRAEQEKLLKKQQEADNKLLRSFGSEDDIYMARNGTITAINVSIDIVKSEILREQKRLPKLLAKAANSERAGERVHENLSASIDQVERAIRDSYAEIIKLENKKGSIREAYERYLGRFRQLKSLPVSTSPVESEEKRPILHNLIVCGDAAECDSLWGKATDYVRRRATTAVQTSNDFIVITAPPATEREISLILSRIEDKEGPGVSLFLDLRCQLTIKGKEFCRSKEAQAIIQGFRPALLSEASSDVP